MSDNTDKKLNALLRKLRHQLTMIRMLRLAVITFLFVGLLWSANQPDPGDNHSFFLIVAGALFVWVISAINSVRAAQHLHAGSVLLGIGRLDEAEVWLGAAITKFSLSARSKLYAAQQLASLFFHRQAHQQVVAICRELLRHRIRGMKTLWINTRLMLADSLLIMDQVTEAYDAMRPIYGIPLSLADKMKLLPIQLRYELAADHADSAVRGLNEKLKIAQLLDSRQAALIHALLAEACRRQVMPAQQAFLAERARLYHDLDKIAERYPVISIIAENSPPSAS